MDVLPNQIKNNEAIITETTNLFQRFIFNFIPNVFNGVFTLIFHHIPSVIYYFLSRTFTLTFQSSSLLIILVILVISVYIYVRYHYQTKYSRLPKPEYNEGENYQAYEYTEDQTSEIYDEKPIQHNYPNEFMNAFLASIKVFGYLDKPVFHELANQLQTRMLSADEVLCRDKSNYSNDFITVVDGEVEVYIPRNGIGNTKYQSSYTRTSESRRNSVTYRSYGTNEPAININGEDSGNKNNNNGNPNVVISTISAEDNNDVNKDLLNPEVIDDDMNSDLNRNNNNSSITYQSDVEQTFDDINLMMDEEELESKYFCLTKVKTGGTLTSLFVILALLINDTKPSSFNNNEIEIMEKMEKLKKKNLDKKIEQMNYTNPQSDSLKDQEKNEERKPKEEEEEEEEGGENELNNNNNLDSPLDLENKGNGKEEETSSRDTIKENILNTKTNPPKTINTENISQLPPLFTPKSNVYRQDVYANEADQNEYGNALLSTYEYPTMYFRAKKRTTLAVIPEKAFRDLKEKYPYAVSHIIQVILTRFQRVTFLTLYKYLGLSDELLQVERKVNEFLSGGHLPERFFPPGGLDRLRRNVKLTKAQLEFQEKNKKKNNMSNRNVTKKSSGAELLDNNLSSRVLNERKTKLPEEKEEELNKQKREENLKAELSDAKKWAEDEVYIKKSIYDGITKYIGVCDDDCIDSMSSFARKRRFTNANTNPLSPPSSPLTTSPYVPRSPSVASSVSSQTNDKDYESIMSDSISDTQSNSFTGDNVSSIGHNSSIDSMPRIPVHSPIDYSSEIKILYYPRGSTLLNEGERHKGLFFVIDGLIEAVSVNKDNKLFMMSRNSPSTTTTTSSTYSHMTQSQKSQIQFNQRKIEITNQQRFNRRYTNDHQSRYNNLTNRNLFNNPNPNNLNITNSPRSVSNKSDTPIRNKPHSSSRYNYSPSDISDSGTMDGTTTELTFSTSSNKTLFYIKPGGLACYFSILNGNQSYVTLKAKTNSYVGFLPRSVLDRLNERYPNVLKTLARRLLSQLSSLIFHIDFALEWSQASAGQILSHEGDYSDAIYIVISGRLRSIQKNKKKDKYTILGEFGQGEIVGETEVLTDSKRQSTIHAIRESEIAIMPKSLINSLAISHPEITLQLSHIIAKRAMEAQPNKDWENQSIDLKRNNTNLRTIAILPISPVVPINDFSNRLYDALVHIGVTVSYLNTSTVVSVLGKHAFNKLGSLKLSSWLADQEANSRIVLYIADGEVKSSWTKRCMSQADCIFLVGLGDGDPTVGELEKLLLRMKTTARKELVLLHSEKYVKPGSTMEWLKRRKWVYCHYHVQMPLNATEILMKVNKKSAFNIINKSIQKYYSNLLKKPFHTPPSNNNTGNKSDFARLARRILSQSIGLVLGGGGARGLAQAGMIKVMEDSGIPIDMVGGTSIGSFIGGLYSQRGDLISILGKLKSFSETMSSTLSLLLDLTYPITSTLTGHMLNRAVWKTFSDMQIEDCWLPYFCVTTNITWSRLEIHLTGYMWRYIRASMSLSGFVPPMCSDKGHLLVDGGYVNNLPADIMRSLGAKTIVAVDVGSVDDTTPIYYGDSLSGWRVFFSRMNPFGKKTGKLPTLTEIQSRLAYVSCVKSLEDVKVMEGCYYLRPPVTSYGTLEFGKLKEISSRGTEYMEEVLKEWKKKNILTKDFGMVKGKQNHGRRYSI